MGGQIARLAQSYIRSMEEIKFRLEVIKDELLALQKRQQKDEYKKNVISAELCYLQFRRISELLALAILEAHREKPAEELRKLESDYRADYLIKRVLECYPRGFPIPIKRKSADVGPEPIDFDENPELFNPSIFTEIYRVCGDRLHVGTLSMVRTGKFKKLDSAQLRGWYEAYVQGLSNHLLPLNEESQMLFVAMHSPENGQIHCRFCEVLGK